MRHRTQLIYLCLGTILFWLSISATALAADGSGGGPGTPLALVSANATASEITLSFNKNVVNDAVKDKNKTCFSLTDAAGAGFPFQVNMAEDQPGSDASRVITLKLVKEFAPNTTYTLKISPELQAKNGSVTGKTITIKLSTSSTQPLAVTTGSPSYSGGNNASGASSSYLIPGAITVVLAGLLLVVVARRKQKA